MNDFTDLLIVGVLALAGGLAAFAVFYNAKAQSRYAKDKMIMGVNVLDQYHGPGPGDGGNG